jgi:glycosyltransferase involved in cell wall biosynthesis
LYWAADLVIGTGRVALEAMACGKPVLAVGVSGYSGPVTRQSLQRSIRIHFGDHGSNAPATSQLIASGILEMLKRQKRLQQLGQFGRDAVVRRFSVVNVAQKMLQIYRSTVKPENGNPRPIPSR